MATPGDDCIGEPCCGEPPCCCGEPFCCGDVVTNEGDDDASVLVDLLAPPVALPPWNSELFWGGVSDADPGARWFREQLFAIGRDLEAH